MATLELLRSNYNDYAHWPIDEQICHKVKNSIPFRLIYTVLVDNDISFDILFPFFNFCGKSLHSSYIWKSFFSQSRWLSFLVLDFLLNLLHCFTIEHTKNNHGSNRKNSGCCKYRWDIEHNCKKSNNQDKRSNEHWDISTQAVLNYRCIWAESTHY